MNSRQLIPRVLLISSVGLIFIWAGLNRDQLDPTGLDSWLSGLGGWAPFVYVGMYAVGTLLFFPGSMFAIAGGALFGPVWGAVLNLFGATIGASMAFIAARYVASDWVARKAAGRLNRLISGVESEGWRFVAFVRLVPLFPFNLTNYALGLTRIRLVPYVITSLVCMAPGAVAYTWLGHAGREALGGDSSAIRYGMLAFGLLAGMVLLPRLVGQFRKTAIKWTEPEDLQEQMVHGVDLAVLDVRGVDEFSGPLGHIPGVMNIPLDELPSRLDALRTRTTNKIVVVCRTDKRSATARELLCASGFKSVTVLRGGMERWNAKGFKVGGIDSVRTTPDATQE